MIGKEGIGETLKLSKDIAAKEAVRELLKYCPLIKVMKVLIIYKSTGFQFAYRF